MATPQHGIFALGAVCHDYLEFDLAPHADFEAMVRAVAELEAIVSTTRGTNLVAGFAPGRWAALAPGDTPPGAAPFESVTGPDGFTMPSTQRDLWLWIASGERSNVFDMARAAVSCLGGHAELVTERSGFTHHDSRDLTGFIDGTENPPLSEAAEVVVVRDGLPGAGASVVLVQVWRHDLGAFEALSLTAQGGVFGHTKADSVELGEEEKPDSAHIARVVIEEDGSELEIFRRSTSYGGVEDHGLVFVAFSAEQRRPTAMLDRMAGVTDGVRDELTRFSTPLTGGYYVVPSMEAIQRFAQGG